MNKVVVGLLVLVALAGIWWASTDSARNVRRAEPIGALVPDAVEPVQSPAPDVELPSSAPERVAQGDPPVQPAPEPVLSPSDVALPHRGLFGRVRRSDGEAPGRRNVKLAVVGAGVRTPMEGTWTTADGHYGCAFDFGSLSALAPKIRTVSLEAFTESVPLEERLSLNSLNMSAQELAEFILEPVWLEVSVKDPQGFRAEKRVELRPNMRDSLRVDLMIRPRHDLEGEALGKHGGASFANITLFDPEWNLLATTRADAKGVFRLSSPPAGRFVIHARQTGGGAAQIAGNFLGAPFRAPQQKVLLGGGATLHGSVESPTGEPVINLPVIAIESGLAEQIYPSVVPSVTELAQAETLGGLAYSVATTNLEGKFDMTSMQAGTYRVRFGTLAEKHQPQTEVLTGSDNTFTFVGDLLTVTLEEKSEVLLRAKVHCLQADWKTLDAGAPIAHFVQPAIFGATQFVLDPGQTWLVFATLDGQYSREIKVRFDARKREEEVDLDFSFSPFSASRTRRSLPPVQGTATLDLSVRNEDGKRQRAQIHLWRKHGRGRVQLIDGERMPLNGEFPSLLPGKYELLVESLLDKDPFVPQRTTFSLSEGETESLKLMTKVAGRLKILLRAKGAQPGFAVGAQAVSINVPGEPIPLSFTSERLGTGLTTTLYRNRLSVCSPALAPGRYKLELSATSNECELPVTSFEIEAGKTLSAEIELELKD